MKSLPKVSEQMAGLSGLIGHGYTINNFHICFDAWLEAPVFQATKWLDFKVALFGESGQGYLTRYFLA